MSPEGPGFESRYNLKVGWTHMLHLQLPHSVITPRVELLTYMYIDYIFMIYLIGSELFCTILTTAAGGQAATRLVGSSFT